MSSALTVEFIVATYNRGPILVDCLRRTLGCGLPPARFAVTVVDNASTDGTADLVEGLAREHACLRLVRLPRNAGPVAKNVALARTTADVAVLLDDDAYPLPGAVEAMLGHFRDDPALGAAVFDVTLPDGTREASAYPDVFIGAGTGLRTAALRTLAAIYGRGGGLLPTDYFMQAEEYDLSFRLNAAGYAVRRFADMPLVHLKSPGARIGQRTTRLDVRNNLYLLARYVPEPLCHGLAADWLARYWLMAERRDAVQPPHAVHGTHKQAFIRGAAEGLDRWGEQRAGGRFLLPPAAVETIFKGEAICRRLAGARERLGLRRIAFADFGKNMLPFYQAARAIGLPVAAVVDDQLAAPPGRPGVDYRGVPIIPLAGLPAGAADALVLTPLSPIHAGRRAADLRVRAGVRVVDLFAEG